MASAQYYKKETKNEYICCELINLGIPWVMRMTVERACAGHNSQLIYDKRVTWQARLLIILINW